MLESLDYSSLQTTKVLRVNKAKSFYLPKMTYPNSTTTNFCNDKIEFKKQKNKINLKIRNRHWRLFHIKNLRLNGNSKIC